MTISQILSRRASRSKIVSGPSSPATPIPESSAHSSAKPHKRSSSLRSFINRFSSGQTGSRTKSSPKSPFVTSEPSTPIIISEPIPIASASPNSADMIPVTPVMPSEPENQILNYEIESLHASFSQIIEEPENSILPCRGESNTNSVYCYPNDSIFMKRGSLEMSFDDEVLSHSTSRLEDPFLNQTRDIEKGNYTDFGSITDADIQTFKPYSRSRTNLKLVATEYEHSKSIDAFDENDENYENNEYPIAEKQNNVQKQVSLSPKNSIIDDLSMCEPDTQDDLQEPLNHIAADKFDNSGTSGDIIGFEFNSNFEVYRNEMMLLVESHKLIMSKQQAEIRNLKQLLEQERNLNKMARSSKNTDAPNSNQKPRFRRKFIPMAIEVDCTPLKTFNLLPPFDPPAPSFNGNVSRKSNTDVEKFGSPATTAYPNDHSPMSKEVSVDRSDKPISKKLQSDLNINSAHRESFSNIIRPTNISGKRVSITSSKNSSRFSGSSTMYYSAFEDYAHTGEFSNWLPKRSLTPLLEKSSERKASVTSSASSIMSNSHRIPSGKTNDSSGSSHSVSNSVSSYTINSNSTTPESTNFHANTFPKLHTSQMTECFSA